MTALCTWFVLTRKFYFCPDYALAKPVTKMVNKSGQAGVFLDDSRHAYGYIFPLGMDRECWEIILQTIYEQTFECHELSIYESVVKVFEASRLSLDRTRSGSSMTAGTPIDELSESEILRRMEGGIRRALETPPTPTRGLVGKTERAKNQRESRAIRARRAKPESGEAS